MVNLENVKKAVELQKSMNNDIDLYGYTTEEKCDQIEYLVDNFNDEESELFVKLYFEK